MPLLHTLTRIAVAVPLTFAVVNAALADDISIHGKVQGYDDKPIFNIKVSVYDDDSLLTHVFTGEDGTYSVSVPAAKIVTVRFDTSTSLNNAREWHPSVVANVGTERDVLLDRRLMEVGMGLTETAAIDALHGYEFAALWIKTESVEEQAAYADNAGARIGMLKLSTRILTDMEQQLRDYFNNYNPQSP
jgi:hypothetical protein